MEWLELHTGISYAGMNPIFRFYLRWRSHRLPDGIEYDPEIHIVFPFERIELGRKFLDVQ